MSYEIWQWALFAMAALIIGMSKCGIPGIGILNVALFQNALLAKDATGFGLPVLIIGDICAVIAYRKHAQWVQVWRLFPWTVAGVFLGYAALKWLDNQQARILIGLLLAGMVVMHFMRSRSLKKIEIAAQASHSFTIAAGILAGFISMVANAAGPVMIIYLLSMRLPKMEFMGVSVYFFMLLNVFKVPFLAHLDLITLGSFTANLKLAPFVVVGGFIGYYFAKKVSQLWFERTAFWLTVLAVGRMLWTAFY